MDDNTRGILEKVNISQFDSFDNILIERFAGEVEMIAKDKNFALFITSIPVINFRLNSSISVKKGVSPYIEIFNSLREKNPSFLYTYCTATYNEEDYMFF